MPCPGRPFHVRVTPVSHRRMGLEPFETVVSAHHTEIYRYLLRVTSRSGDADDQKAVRSACGDGMRERECKGPCGPVHRLSPGTDRINDYLCTHFDRG